MTVSGLLRNISSSELTEWVAYDRIDPFGEERNDLRTGMICAVTANHSMSPSKTARKPSDYMLYSNKPESDKPILLVDPVAHAKLIKQRLFGKKD